MKRLVLLFLLIVVVQIVGAAPPTSQDLLDDTPSQSRDMSFPGSRIVVNPFNFKAPDATSPSDYSNRATLPLNTGYLSEERSDMRMISGLLHLYRWQGIRGSRGRVSVRVADTYDPTDWPAEAQTRVDTTSEGIRFSVDADADPVWKYISPFGTVGVDMTQCPTLVVAISASSGDNWALKMRNAMGDTRTIRSDAPGVGRYEFRLSDFCPWTGSQEITFELYSIGRGSWIEIGRFELVTATGEPIFSTARTYSTAWAPHALPFRAFYPDGSSLSGSDYFYDNQTIIRRVAFDTVGLGSNPYFVVVGLNCGRSFSFRDGVFALDMGAYSVAIASDAFRGARVTYYRTQLEAEYQSGGSSWPRQGYWAIVVDARRLPNAELLLSVTFSGPGADRQALADQAMVPFRNGDAVAREAASSQYWDEYLKKVPEPADFAIRAVNPRHVTPAQMRQAYYKAWVFLGQSVLDPVSDRYPYPQIVTGKPSLWDEGEERARYSATWESLLGMQLYGFIDPTKAWDSFEGIMSLTDSVGMIGGESLPSRKAQTAWVLYNMTRDTARLIRVRAPLERYLDWRVKYPHWIMHGAPDPTIKDAEFVFSVLTDMEFMARICEALGDPTGALTWRGRREMFYREIQPWFWISPEATPVQYYNTETEERSPGATYWVTSGLACGMLQGSYLSSMLRLFDTHFDPTGNFGGASMGLPKYPDISYTVYGLLFNGRATEASRVIDACLRDVVRSGGWFAEQYATNGKPYPSGVRPSLFGAAMMIDFMMLKNGLMYGWGEPIAVRFPSQQIGIRGVRYGDRVLDLETVSEGKYRYAGNYLSEPVVQKIELGSYSPVREKRRSRSKK